MTHARYSSSAKFFHWAIALLLAFQMAMGWRMEDLPLGPDLFTAAQLHKSVGILILLLTLGRIGLRWFNPPPPLMTDSVWAGRLAKGVHHALYGFMIGAPLTGWILVSTAKTKFATLLFGLVPWPHLPLPQSWHEPAEGLHGLLAFLGLLLFVLHVAGALRHQFFKGENVLGRMLPFMTAAPVSRGLGIGAAILALFAMWVAHGAGWQWPLKSAPQPDVSAPAAPPAAQAETLAVAPDAEAPKTTEEAEAEDEGEGDEKKLATLPVADWVVAPGGNLGFIASWTGTPVNGSFGRWTSAIRFSPDDLAGSTIRVTVDLASANTQDSQRDEMLQGDGFFNAAAHPQAVFTSSKISAKGGDRYQAAGTLALNGKSRPVTLDFTLKIKDDVARVSGATRLDRTAFGVGTGEWAATDQIAANVSVNFAFSAKRKP